MRVVTSPVRSFSSSEEGGKGGIVGSLLKVRSVSRRIMVHLSKDKQLMASLGKGEGAALSGISSWGCTRGFGGPLCLSISLTNITPPFFCSILLVNDLLLHKTYVKTEFS